MKRQHAVVLAALLAATGAAGFAAAVVLPTHRDDPRWVTDAKVRAKRLAGDVLVPVAHALRPLDPAAGPALPFDGPGFFYEDLGHPYLERVRRDPRLARFYGGEPLAFDDLVVMADFLRGRFPADDPDFDDTRANVLELLDAADGGQGYRCGTAAKMLIQMAQAGGVQGRRVRLGGHVVAEVWLEPWGWVVVDPHVNVHYRDAAGRPLSALEIHRRVRSGARDDLVPVPGPDPATRWERHRQILTEVWGTGFAIDYHAKWLTLDLSTWDPRVSPSQTSVFYAPAGDPENPLFRRSVRDPAPLYAPPPPAS